MGAHDGRCSCLCPCCLVKGRVGSSYYCEWSPHQGCDPLGLERITTFCYVAGQDLLIVSGDSSSSLLALLRLAQC